MHPERQGAYRSPSPPEAPTRPALPFVATGPLVAAAVTNAALVCFFGAVALGITHGRLSAWCGTAVALLLAVGARWRVVVDGDGLVFSRLSAWVVPVRREKHLLDVTIDLYEAWEDAEPSGICVRRRPGERGSEECFGPARDVAMGVLRARIYRAIHAARAIAPPLPKVLRVPWLQGAALDPLLVRGASSSRITQARTTRAVKAARATLPAGTVLALNTYEAKEYVDPRRQDVIDHATVPAFVFLPEVGLTAWPGAELHFDALGRVRATKRAFDGVVQLGGFPLDGKAWIAWDEATGELRTATLGEAAKVGGFTLPMGTTLTRWPLAGRGGRWDLAFSLAGEVTLPELTLRPGEHMHFSRSGALVEIRIDRDVPLGEGKMLRSHRLPVSVHPDGRIDRKTCRRAGML
jgi:hypothetical protein